MRLDKMRKPIIRQEPGIERWAFGPRRGSTKVEQRFSVGCLDDQRAEFGARSDANRWRSDMTARGAAGLSVMTTW